MKKPCAQAPAQPTASPPPPNVNVLNPHGAKDAVSRAAALAMQFATKGGASKVGGWESVMCGHAAQIEKMVVMHPSHAAALEEHVRGHELGLLFCMHFLRNVLHCGY